MLQLYTCSLFSYHLLHGFNARSCRMRDSQFLSTLLSLVPFGWVSVCLCCTSLWFHPTTPAVIFLFSMFHTSFQIPNMIVLIARLSFILHIFPNRFSMLSIIVCITFFLSFTLNLISSFVVLCCHWCSSLVSSMSMSHKRSSTIAMHACKTISFVLILIVLLLQIVMNPVIVPCDFTMRCLISEL